MDWWDIKIWVVVAFLGVAGYVLIFTNGWKNYLPSGGGSRTLVNSPVEIAR